MPDTHEIECNTNPSNFLESKNALEKYLIDKLGEDYQCLFYLDEHHKMNPSILDEGNTG